MKAPEAPTHLVESESAHAEKQDVTGPINSESPESRETMLRQARVVSWEILRHSRARHPKNNETTVPFQIRMDEQEIRAAIEKANEVLLVI